LRQQGVNILARNYKSPRGEVDIIGVDQKILVFYEIKTWQGWGAEQLNSVIGPRKRERIIKTAQVFMNEKGNSLFFEAFRFDVLLVKSDGTSLEHWKNAFGDGGWL